jgi:homoserine O-succinyltransferase
MNAPPRNAVFEPTGRVAPLRIGLVNNMPDAALRATERQFRELLTAAAGILPFTLDLFTLPGVPRGEVMQRYLRETHASTDTIAAAGLDALIVTGSEPRASRLSDEPYWARLAELVDWAETGTIASVWSCLAAHAAVLHRDGIARQPLSRKCSGVFACAPAGPHELLANLPAGISVPHSRHNELDRVGLEAAGYDILTVSDQAGVDLFVRSGKSLSVFFQGHPEYDATALMREYRRDVARCLKGESGVMPPLPVGYFGADVDARLVSILDHATISGVTATIATLDDVLLKARLEAPWKTSAVGVYRNWLGFIAREKNVASMERPSGLVANR